jgi:hypothetical protein
VARLVLDRLVHLQHEHEHEEPGVPVATCQR